MCTAVFSWLLTGLMLDIAVATAADAASIATRLVTAEE